MNAILIMHIEIIFNNLSHDHGRKSAQLPCEFEEQDQMQQQGLQNSISLIP